MAVGILLLVIGGNFLVRHASRLAEVIGVPTIIVGLTVVAFGTGSPEFFTSVYGRFVGEGGMALGNVVGGIIFNVFFILGCAAVMTPLTVHSKLLSQEIPVVLVISVTTVLFSLSGTIGRWESSLLLCAVGIYTGWVAYQSINESIPVEETEEVNTETVPAPETHWAVSLLVLGFGLVLLFAGGRIFITSAARVATEYGISREVIGLTIIGMGTSLPELVTTMMAAYRGESDIAVGNVVGSNLFNLTVVLGCTGLVGSGELDVSDTLLEFDMLVMVAAAVVCLPVMFSGRRLDRWEGVVFVLYYLGYLTTLILQATGNLDTWQSREALLFFVIPLSLLTFVVIGYRAFREM